MYCMFRLGSSAPEYPPDMGSYEYSNDLLGHHKRWVIPELYDRFPKSLLWEASQ